MTLAAFLTVVACGGGGKKDATSLPSATTSPAAASQATRAPSGSPAASASPSASGAGTPAPSGTASAGAPITATKLADLKSYRYNLKMSGHGGPLADLQSSFGSVGAQDISLEVDGSYVNPDKGQMTMAISGIKIARTIIGKQEWSTFNGTTTGPTAAASLDPEDLSLAVAFWDEGFLDSAQNFQCSGTKETVNGVATRRCSIDKQTFEQINGLGGGNLVAGSNFKDLSAFTFDAWLAEDSGYPARFRAQMAGKDNDDQDFNFNVALDVTDANKSIDIKPPS